MPAGGSLCLRIRFRVRPPGIRLAIPALVGGGIISVFAMHKNRKEVFRMAVLTAAIFFLILIRCGIQEQTYQNHLENARQHAI